MVPVFLFSFFVMLQLFPSTVDHSTLLIHLQAQQPNVDTRIAAAVPPPPPSQLQQQRLPMADESTAAAAASAAPPPAPLQQQRLRMSDESARRIADKWDKAADTFVSGGAWHQHPLVVRTYKQRLASGSETFVTHLREKYGVRAKCLSIGCGDGGIEVEMVQAGLCETMEGIDLSPARVNSANQRVPPELRERVKFSVQNAETDLDGQGYDLVLFTHALHHIFDLEAMSTAIRDKIMDPIKGILVLEEYVGPVRWQFPQTHLDAMAGVLKSLEVEYPERVRHIRQNPLWDGNAFIPPDAESIEKDDPSETIRSNEIIPVLSQYFTLVEDVPLGGSFFQWIFHNAYNSLKDDGTGQEIVQKMLDAEMQAIADGKVASDYVFQVWKNTGR